MPGAETWGAGGGAGTPPPPGAAAGGRGASRAPRGHPKLPELSEARGPRLTAGWVGWCFQTRVPASPQEAAEASGGPGQPPHPALSLGPLWACTTPGQPVSKGRVCNAQPRAGSQSPPSQSPRVGNPAILGVSSQLHVAFLLSNGPKDLGRTSRYKFPPGSASGFSSPISRMSASTRVDG